MLVEVLAVIANEVAHGTDEGKRRAVEAAGQKKPPVVNLASKKAAGE
jgi:hypothetical protein